MINLLNRRECLTTYDLTVLHRAKGQLDEVGICHRTRTNSIPDPGRGRGVPGIQAEAAYQYRLYVRRKDYYQSVHLLERGGHR